MTINDFKIILQVNMSKNPYKFTIHIHQLCSNNTISFECLQKFFELLYFFFGYIANEELCLFFFSYTPGSLLIL